MTRDTSLASADAADLDRRAGETFVAIMTNDPPKGWRVAARDTQRGATYFAHRDGRRFLIEGRPGERIIVTRL